MALHIGVMSMAIFLLCVIFQHNTFGNAETFWSITAKIAISLLLSSPLLLVPKRVTGIIITVLCAIWCMCNQIYFRANGIVLTVNAIRMAGNLHGFESAILSFLDYSLLYYVVTLIAYIVFVCKVDIKTDYGNKYIHFGMLVLMSLFVLIPISKISEWRSKWDVYETQNVAADNIIRKTYNYTKELLIPLYKGRQYAKMYFFGLLLPDEATNWENRYASETSILTYLFTELVFQAHYDYYESHNAYITISDEGTLKQLSTLYAPSDTIMSSRPLVLILMESIESWVLDAKDIEGRAIAPNLKKISEDKHSMYYPQIVSQVKHGVSGDGQLIVNTGILPIQNGAACRLFGDNTYPNIASHFENTYAVNPSPGTWNKSVTMPAYGYKKLLEPENGTWNDDELLDILAEKINNENGEAYCAFAMTITTHSPFKFATSKHLRFSDQLPTNVQDYLRCVHYMDSCIGHFYDECHDKLISDSALLVITSDHTVFKKNMFADIVDNSSHLGIDFGSDTHNYCPLIITDWSMDRPSLSGVYYQMDIYPTICAILNLNPSWHGVGIPVTEDTSTREISEEQAYQLSDLIIRSNYFQGK